MMVETTLTVKLKASADTVWRLIGGFDALPDWQPAVAASTLEDGGRVRRVAMADGNTVLQRLLWHRDEERAYSYSMGESHLPVADYVAGLRVVEEGGGATCRVEWTSAFEPVGRSEDEARRVIEDIHGRGLEHLKSLFGGG
jgi:uncharacterized protein YndB with AHSA1/START domain